jgi:cell division protein FtsB
MSRKKYTPEEIIQILRTVEIELGKGLSQEESVRKSGITVTTWNRWKKEFGGLRVDQAKRLKELEQENNRLKRVVADLSVDNQILKEAAKGNY